MQLRHLSWAAAAGLLVCGLATTGPARVHAQNATVLPQEKVNPITMVGCFQQTTIKDHEKYVLMSPTIGAAGSVPEATCNSTDMENAIRLDHMKKQFKDDSMLGRWVQVTGKLEKFESPKEIRELTVSSVSLVPVVPPRAAEVMPPPAMPQAQPPAPEPQAEVVQPPAASEETPIATSGQKQLPRTASQLPLLGAFGLFALGAGLALQLLTDRRVRG